MTRPLLSLAKIVKLWPAAVACWTCGKKRRTKANQGLMFTAYRINHNRLKSPRFDSKSPTAACASALSPDTYAFTLFGYFLRRLMQLGKHAPKSALQGLRHATLMHTLFG
mmetsp:Transcript_58183/g.85286  ORF Transcript_58183/g.85286 Transcript_58183/m.85286 type:complete len:110 (+) Transcript_58183:406-735(+)